MSEILTVRVPVSARLIAEAGGLPSLLHSAPGRIVSTPPAPRQIEAGPWQVDLVVHDLLPGTWVYGPEYAQVEAAWTDEPPVRWEQPMWTFVNFRLRVLGPDEAATDTHLDPQP